METSRKITTIFMVVALLAMAALAFWTNRQDETTQIVSPLPGLAENLVAIQKITDFPHTHLRSVRIISTPKFPMMSLATNRGTIAEA